MDFLVYPVFIMILMLGGILMFGPELFGATMNAIEARKAKPAVVASPKKKRSRAANAVLSEYNSLPAEYQKGNIESIVDALDVKYGIERVGAHYSHYYYNSDPWTAHKEQCNGIHYSYKSFRRDLCVAPEYYEMYEEIKALKADIAKQKKEIEIAGVQHELDAIGELMEGLRQERAIVRDVTREITNGKQ